MKSSQSHFDLSPVNICEVFLLIGIRQSGIVKTALRTVFLVEILLNGLGDADEIGEVLRVVDVRVEVVLEVLKHVHVLLHELVSAHPRELEGLVVEFPRVHERLGVGCALLAQVFHDFESILEILNVKLAGEVLHFFFHLVGGDVEGLLARAVRHGIKGVALLAVGALGIVATLVEGNGPRRLGDYGADKQNY